MAAMAEAAHGVRREERTETASHAGPEVEVDVLITARLPIPEPYVFRASENRLAAFGAALRRSGGMLDARCLAYVVRHPDAGPLLIDTGFHPDASQSLRQDFGVTMGLFFRGLKPAREPYSEQLRALGVEAEGVERVVMTHLHVDHTSGMRLLPSARFVCSRAEWGAANGPRASGKGYVARHLPEETRMELLDFDASGESHGPFAKTVDLLGDGSVRLISTPGHTPGHLSVLLRAKGGRQVVIVGDAVYTLRSLREELLPLLTANDGAYRRSLRELKAFAEQNPDATLVPSHDPSAWRALRPQAPEASARESGVG